MRKTFTTDMPNFFQKDVPHFFQDDIPCAFGGQPTSGTKTACKGSAPRQAQPAAKNNPPHEAPVTNDPAANSPRDTTVEQKPLSPQRTD